MPEHDNDRLEQFFRKAASQPDIPFNEADWEKLEARLDAADAPVAVSKTGGNKLTAAVVVIAALIFTAALWVNYRYASAPASPSSTTSTEPDRNREEVTTDLPGQSEEGAEQDALNGRDRLPSSSAPALSSEERLKGTAGSQLPVSPEKATRQVREAIGTLTARETIGDRVKAITATGVPLEKPEGSTVRNVNAEQIFEDLIKSSPAFAARHKQKAIVDSPGAEEGNTGAAGAVVREELVCNQENHTTAPRLSLLLSFAPDFSSTSIHRYSAPGTAFGAMVQYHLLDRWRLSAGVVKNNKAYTGAGEDYHPPYGYWKYYTNGRIPASIDGACSVLEFPLMVHYTFRQGRRNVFTVGAGVSSYLMLSESYQYFFDTPNPGAKDGWTSAAGRRPGFMFNMVNFTVGYEHQVLPGFMIGIEPYLKIPVEEIGWSNLKLYSTGASVTMRYVILQKKSLSLSRHSRGPD